MGELSRHASRFAVYPSDKFTGMHAEITANKQRGRPFKPGSSGNPDGRPRGACNKTTIAIEELLDGEAETITRKAIEEAKKGNMQAIKLCMDDLAPPRKDRAITFDAPKMKTASDAVNVMASLFDALAEGEITPSEAQAVTGIVETFRRTIETEDHENRLRTLEGEKSR